MFYDEIFRTTLAVLKFVLQNFGSFSNMALDKKNEGLKRLKRVAPAGLGDASSFRQS
jgi:hypothetical protein